jgi:hypothetical protein
MSESNTVTTGTPCGSTQAVQPQQQTKSTATTPAPAQGAPRTNPPVSGKASRRQRKQS